MGCVFAGPLVSLNELVTSNGATLADEEGDFPDWFELFNGGDATAVLDGYGLSDDPKKPFRWRLQNAQLAPGEFLVIFASGKDRQPSSVPSLMPGSLGGIRAWLAADAIAINDAQQVRNSGGNLFVRRWNDASGSGLDAVQAADSQQPRLIANSINGRPALRFDGANDTLLLPRPAGTNSFTLVSVFRTGLGHEVDPESSGGVGGVSGQRWLFGAAHGGDFNGGAGVSVGTNGVSVYEHGSGYMPALAVYAGRTGSPWALLTVTYDAKRPTISVQGSTVRNGVGSPRAQVTAPTEIGAGSYGAFSGDLAEVLMFDRPLTEAERRGLERWLADKYSIPLPQPRHTDFNLSADGESLVLTAPDGQLVDRVDFGVVPRDVSLGRQPDLSGPWLLFPQPTPGASNSTPAAAELLGPVEFSVAGGFHTSAVQLTLSVPNPGATIRYTLDGSEPTEASPVYSIPLSLGSRVGTANNLSTIPTAGGWQAPAGEVFKGWTVRARAFKTGALAADTVTQSYFVTARGIARYSVPVVSLSTARANFFDAAIGIYVPGNTGANFSQRGPEWERPIFVEMFETNGVRVLAQEAAVSIHGNTSQNFPIKGLDLDAEGGKGRRPFRYQIFPDRQRDSFENLLLRPSGHDHYMSFMRDELMQSLMADTGAESQAARLCVVFLNGEYWGLHYLKEKEDTEFIAFYAGREKDEVDYLESYATPRAGDTQQWDALIQLLTANNASDAGVYAQVQTLMEVPSYIDYKAAEIFTYRWDIGNHRFWRPRTPEGRFRWIQFDNDVGWGGFWSNTPAWEFNMLQAVLEASGSLHDHNNETTTFLLRRLVENAEFKRDFINRFCDLLNTVHRPSNTTNRINAFAKLIEPEMAEHAQRWRAPGSLAEWRGHVQYLRDYANRRPAFVRQHLRQKFSLGADFTVRAAVSDPAAGRVFVNTIPITSPTNAPWSGVYFRNHLLPFTAEAMPGYRFAGWDGLFGVTTNRVTLRLNSDFTVTALFEPAEVTLHAVLQNGELVLQVHGAAGSGCTVEHSADVGLWSFLRSITLDANGTAEFRQPVIGAAEFYRVRMTQ